MHVRGRQEHLGRRGDGCRNTMSQALLYIRQGHLCLAADAVIQYNANSRLVNTELGDLLDQ